MVKPFDLMVLSAWPQDSSGTRVLGEMFVSLKISEAPTVVGELKSYLKPRSFNLSIFAEPVLGSASRISTTFGTL